MDEPHLAPFVAIVDDEEPVRIALGRLLGAMGLRAQGFADGTSFLAFLEGARPDCLILDLHMPGMSGLDLLRALRARQRPLPTIVITAHDEPETRGNCLRAGAAVYLRKPLDGNALFGAIAEALGERGAAALHRHPPRVQ
jgi:FixJ family two-component response regulator